MSVTLGPISQFIENHYHHFNAAALKDAARSYKEHLQNNNKMFVTLAGAMSTAELGRSLAQMIREDKVHGICCTGANLEEDIYNLVAHDEYKRIPNYRNLTLKDEQELYNQGFNRVTDTCIPEDSAMRKIEKILNEYWKKADDENKTYAPHEYFWMLLRDERFNHQYQIPPENSWMIAAMEKNIPIFTPGWEDSTNGNMFAAANIDGRIKNVHIMENGISCMIRLTNWYREITTQGNLGFFQIGGGIAGDFPICVVPLLHQDLEVDVPKWGYFCQISDSTTSYGSYSGAIPSEKITWGKLTETTPQFVIESDATIVAPLIFSYVLNH
ncbi:deoxyhypusine synthase family protein [Bacteriovoracaceae bacterium]|nr:deoxyhypusine synthase family protein [Bacteriovoracaceae bacterium]